MASGFRCLVTRQLRRTFVILKRHTTGIKYYESCCVMSNNKNITLHWYDGNIGVTLLCLVPVSHVYILTQWPRSQTKYGESMLATRCWSLTSASPPNGSGTGRMSLTSGTRTLHRWVTEILTILQSVRLVSNGYLFFQNISHTFFNS